MPKFEITPAHSPEVMCEFVIPRGGNRKPIEFTVPRMEYTPKAASEKFDEWWTERTTPQPVMKDGEPVTDPLTGEPKTTVPEPISERESVLKTLECAGVSKAIMRQIDELTIGEIKEIWQVWQDASKVSPGESDASETS